MNQFKLYLKSLSLQNFATFENQEINFHPKLNAIVGETGSGKSLILDALQIVFGGRADKKLIRKNSDFATVEAIFYSEDEFIKKYFKDLGHPFERNEIVVKKVIYANESSKSYLNFQLCSVSTLNNFSKRFIDLVGQFENQKLLSEDYQLILLDSFSFLNESVLQYQTIYRNYNDCKNELKRLNEEKLLMAQREDYVRFQLEELDRLSPSIDDEQALIRKKDLIQNKEKRQTIIGAISLLISEDEHNISDLLKLCVSKAEKNPELIRAETIEKMYEVKSLLDDISFDLSKEINFEQEEESIDEIVDRLDLYQRLKRKFGGSTEEMINAYDNFKTESHSFAEIEENIGFATTDLENIEIELNDLANQIHTQRVAESESLSDLITQKIQELRMEGASVEILVSACEEFNARGISKIEFLVETNPGEGFYRLKEIASGGELSRILLAIRQVLSSSDTVSVFLFDEIDTGIGGETALYIGKSLSRVAEYSQVLAITHLPQIANYADHLVNVSKVTKQIDEQTTRTTSIVQCYASHQKDEVLKKMNPSMTI